MQELSFAQKRFQNIKAQEKKNAQFEATVARIKRLNPMLSDEMARRVAKSNYWTSAT